MTNGERFVQKDHQIGEQLLGGVFEGQADADTACAEQGPDRRKLNTKALEQHEGAHDPDQSFQQGLEAFEQLLKIGTRPLGDSMQEANANPVGEANQHDGADDSQERVVRPHKLSGQSEIILGQDENNNDAEWQHRIRQGAKNKIIEIAGRLSGEPGQDSPEQDRRQHGDAEPHQEAGQKVRQIHGPFNI